MRPPFLALLIVATMIAPLAAAQTPESDTIVGTVVWEGEPRAVERDLVVAEGGTLIVRGIDVTLHGVHIEVERGGALVVESLPGAPARMLAGASGWTLRVVGGFDLRGLPDAPVLLEGIGGMTSRAGGLTGAVAFEKGLTIAAGRMDARHAIVRDYDSGIMLGGEAKGQFEDVVFESDAGLGIVASYSDINITNARFVGSGATVFFTVGRSPALVRNVSFADSDVAIWVRDSDVTVEGFTGTNVTVCLQVTGGVRARLAARDVACDGFGSAALSITGARSGTTSGAADVSVEDFRFASDLPVSGAVKLAPDTSATLRDGEIGPVNGVGISAEESLPELENVVFRDVTGYNVYLIDPPVNGTLDRLGGGEPGGDGWLIVARSTRVRVLDAAGEPAPEVAIVIYQQANGTLLQETRTDATGATGRLLFETFRIGPDGEGVVSSYRLVAQGASSEARAERQEYVPEGKLLVLRLGTAPGAGRDTPVPAAPLLVIALGAAALLGRREHR